MNSYEKQFFDKIQKFEKHNKYSTLKEKADWCIREHKGYGLNQIHVFFLPLKTPSDFIVQTNHQTNRQIHADYHRSPLSIRGYVEHRISEKAA